MKKRRLSKWLLPIGHFDKKTLADRRLMGHSTYTDRPHKMHWLSGVRFVACGRPIEKVDYTEDFEKWSTTQEGKLCKRCKRRKPTRTP